MEIAGIFFAGKVILALATAVGGAYGSMKVYQKVNAAPSKEKAKVNIDDLAKITDEAEYLSLTEQEHSMNELYSQIQKRG